MTQSKPMNAKMQWLTYQLRRLGWQGQLAILLLVATVVIFFIVQSNNADADRLQLVVEDLQRSVPVEIKREKQSNYIAKRFYQALPSENEANQKIADVLTLIEKHGLALNRSDYSTRAIPQSSMVLYQIKFPLVAQYPTIRNFVTEVMNSQRTIALSHINFKRDDLNSDVVSANLEFVLYTKAAGKE
ncbi:type 4a pilus biogenesis protein PilO [Methylophaga pinxianii]|uniref:type 4a pilus biogenesis protein PilO n=1 Tax=Methylophaga pinxianii TaxID=2881052 RepID=UPI001CF25B86|nr:type 4a pilus biogenesis protein PilO [Methylophaga pinxianii]MCB2426951.1 type 4a pilus biogenesis protein PilO [Methylophaga pinxianii]UPH44843.1 type 4a pilus biogenesis protein PilO [Methylophaga pinxianii]